ncbi:uncharacterized protein LOC106640960 [Copidosoma floridanum]|uniref:uncharacterized protein LOC106640960 n=1 Tax=Copidosoma floridanum TaxID=29053 RepID=UPI000C6F968F|nr:uncharacterized protein LOC106640960 [Copidosoma floridanum]
MTTADGDPATITNMADDDDDEQPEVLQPCAVCGRKFNPRSLDKHVKICERTTTKKRKPFDSARQRIQGTELAEFLPKQHQQQSHGPGADHSGRSNRHQCLPTGTAYRRPSNAWKQTRDEFLRAIRAARGDTQQSPTAAASSSSSQRPSTLSLVKSTIGAPTRSNEKGQCPTCQRQFGLKSYERHVAFCRERATRLPASPQTSNNVAKERLDARMKYRAPALRNRKPPITNREKYSPGAAAHRVAARQSSTSPPPPTLATMHRSTGRAPTKDNQAHDAPPPKLPALGKQRTGHHQTSSKESSPANAAGPLKSRPVDRSNRTPDSQESLNPPVRQLFTSRRLQLLTDAIPSSKILRAGLSPSRSATSSQKSSARLVTRFLKKAFAEPTAHHDDDDDDEEEEAKAKTRKKPRSRRKEEEEEEVPGNRDFTTWRQIREDARQNCELASIDKEEEPALSDVTGLSSRSCDDPANSTTDEFEYNERLVSREEDDGEKSLKKEDISDPGSTRTFRKEEESCCVQFVDSLDSCLYQRRAEPTHDYDIEDTDDDTETLKSCKIDEEEEEEELNSGSRNERSESFAATEGSLPALLPPIKCHSMPNMGAGPPELAFDGFRRNYAASGKPKEVTAYAGLGHYRQQRCATYVIEERCQPGRRRQKQHQQPDDTANESSEEKPLRKRRKLQSEGKRCRVGTGARARLDEDGLSDVSSVRTDDQRAMLVELDDDFGADETESNASELLREIDGALRTGYGSEDSLLDLVGRMRNIELGAMTRDHGRRRRRSDGGQFAGTRSERRYSEICTVTRLDETRGGGGFLPSIGAPGQRSVRKEHRRNKTSSRPRGLETPREDDEDGFGEDERFAKARRHSRSDRRSLLRRSFERLPRCDWNSYARRHPDFSMILRGRTGTSKDYDPFLLAEQQLNDLFSDTSDQSSTDGSTVCPPSSSTSQKPNSSPSYQSPSAFAKYPNPLKSHATPLTNDTSKHPQQQRRLSVIAPPTGFNDDLTSSDLSSDCTETNDGRLVSSVTSVSAGIGASSRELGRRLIIDQSLALGGGEFAPTADTGPQSQQPQNGLALPNRANSSRPAVPARSNSLRSSAGGAHKPAGERKLSSSSSSSSSGHSDFAHSTLASKPCSTIKPSCRPAGNNTSHNHKPASATAPTPNGSNSSSLSLSSIISCSDAGMMKRSNSLFDELLLLSSFDDDHHRQHKQQQQQLDSSSSTTLPSLMSLMQRNDTSLSLVSSSTCTSQRNEPAVAAVVGNGRGTVVTGNNSRNGSGRINCSDDDAELSSPESVKRQEGGGKLSADSAYSSLNRKYSSNGRSGNDLSASCKYKLSKFCHECGFKFPDSAKFCCECGVKRLTL